MNSKKGTIFIIIASLMFGSYGIWSKLIGNSFDNFYQGWTRALIILIILTPVLLFTKQIVPIHKKDWKWLSVFLLFTSFTQAPLFYAFNNMDVGTATLLFFVSMLLTMYFFGIFFLKEKLNKIKIISLLLAIFGLFVVFSISLIAFSIIAALMAILNGVASGGEVSSSKKLTGDYSPLYVTYLSWLIILLTNAPISILLGETQHIPSLDIVWLYALGYAICSIFGFWLIIKGLQYVEASVGSLLGLLEIVFSISLGMLIFQETLTLQILIGAILIIIASALPNINDFIKERKKISN